MREMTSDEFRLMQALENHKGRKNAIKGRKLAYRLFGLVSDETQPAARERYRNYERKLRLLIHDLMFDFGIPIVGDYRGYYLVEEIDEVEAAAATLRKHGIAELVHAAMLKKIAPAELVGQLVFEFGPHPSPLPEGEGTDASPLPAHLTAITTILGEYQRDPEKYAEEIRRVQEKFSPMFIGREDVDGIDKAMETLRKIKQRIM